MRKNFGILTVAVFLLLGCTLKKGTAKAEEKEEPIVIKQQPRYQANDLAGEYRITQIESIPELNEIYPTLTIKKDGTIGGNNGCNSYFGKLNLSEEGPVFENIGATRKACEGFSGELENAIISAFEAGNVLDTDEKGILLMEDNKVVLKAQRITLANGEWQLTMLGSNRVSEPIVFFNVNEGVVAGTTGCNSFYGVVEETGYEVKFKDISATEMDCKDFDTVAEVVFLRALEKVTHYKQIGLTAIFYNGDEVLFELENMEEL